MPSGKPAQKTPFLVCTGVLRLMSPASGVAKLSSVSVSFGALLLLLLAPGTAVTLGSILSFLPTLGRFYESVLAGIFSLISISLFHFFQNLINSIL
jgi:hypothetical protein